jgi:hypothetical protein
LKHNDLPYRAMASAEWLRAAAARRRLAATRDSLSALVQAAGLREGEIPHEQPFDGGAEFLLWAYDD